MNFTSMSKTRHFWTGHDFCLMMTLSVALLLPFAKVGLATTTESVQHFKMLSTIEYTSMVEVRNLQHFKMLSTVEYRGKGQFRNQVETLFSVRKQPLGDDKVRYNISTNDFSLAELSFVVDRKTKRLSEGGKDLVLLESVNNRCVRYLRKVTKENVGKTWKQSFNLSFLAKSLPSELKFTLKAIRVKTKVFGEMIAVRALSEPFVVEAAKNEGGVGSVKCRIGAVYVFDPEIEDIYLSISAFEATTKMNGRKEKLRHEVATYMTDAEGKSVELSGLGKKFGKLVRKLGLTKKSFKIVKESPLPRWAQSEVLDAAQVANICAAIACEGAANPVVTVCAPVTRTVAMQSLGTLGPVGGLAAAGGSIAGSLGATVPGIGGAAIVPGAGMGLVTAGAIAGGTVGTVAVAGGGGGGGGGGVASPK